jgi:putative membrane protein
LPKVAGGVLQNHSESRAIKARLPELKTISIFDRANRFPAEGEIMSIVIKRLRLVVIVAVGVLAFAVGAQARAQDPTETTDRTRSSSQEQSKSSPTDTGARNSQSADHHFIKGAAEGGMAEVELGQLASEKASNGEVKKFGQRMVEDHQKANDRLKEIAAKKGVDLPTEPNSKQKATKERLSKLSGGAFDKAYIETMLKDHKKDVADFQKESSNGHDPDAKQFASETLPTLQDHLREVESIAPKVQESARSSKASPTR